MICEAKVDLDDQNTCFLWDFEAKVDFPILELLWLEERCWFDEAKVESSQPSLEILRKSNFLVHIRWDNPHLLLNLFVSLNETNDLSKLCWWATIYLLWMIKLDRGLYQFIDGCLVDSMSLQKPWHVFNQRKELEIYQNRCVGNKTLFRGNVHLTPWVCRLATLSIALNSIGLVIPIDHG